MFTQGSLPAFLMLQRTVLAFAVALLWATPAMAQAVDTDDLYRDFAKLYNAQKYAEALPLAERRLEAVEKQQGKESHAYVFSLVDLADTYRQLRRFDSALPLYESAKDLGLKVKGVSAKDYAGFAGGLGKTYAELNRRAEAINAYTLQVRNLERVPDIKPAELLPALLSLAYANKIADQVADARRHWERALGIQELHHGPESAEVATTLANIATTLRDDENGYEEAKALEERALKIRIKVYGARHVMVGISLMNRANAERLHGNYAAAKGLSLQALEIMRERHGESHFHVGAALRNLASIQEELGELEEALAHYKAAVATYEKSMGEQEGSSALAFAHQGIGSVLLKLEKPGPAIEHLRNALRLYQVKGLSPYTFGVIATKLGEASLKLNLVNGALAHLEQAMEQLRREAQLTSSKEHFGIAALGARSELQTAVDLYLLALHKAQAAGLRPASSVLSSTFEALQSATRSNAALALTRMASRLATSDGELAKLVREYQDNSNEFRALDSRLRELLSSSEREPSANIAITVFRAQHSTLAELLTLQRRMINIKFPLYSKMIDPKALTLSEVQVALAPNEAMIVFHFADNDGYVWSITKDAAHWVKLGMSTAKVVEHVRTLRCGLDSSNWRSTAWWPEDSEEAVRRKEEQSARRSRCRELTGANVTADDQPPFDLFKAHELYKALFAGIEAQIRGKALIVVASGPLTQLPLQVLVTSMDKKTDQLADVAWMAKSHAISLLPTISNLQALREVARASSAPQPFIGFGNPLVLGLNGNDKRAFSAQACPKPKPSPGAVSKRSKLARDRGPELYARFFRGGLGDVGKLRNQTPLPETTKELCAIARAMGAPDTAVHLGAGMSETAIRKLNADGVLAKYRVVHFATHGLLAQESEEASSGAAKPALSAKPTIAEPALLLTPPEKATNEDDGLLTASEIAQLKLNADWVVLSACNTAAGLGRGSAAPLSGLASAFFYSGSRALLVSHWYVDSRAAVVLTSGAFAELQRNPSIGRAEAFRRSVVASMKDKERPKSEGSPAHPSVWAPFVLVGEGGANR